MRADMTSTNWLTDFEWRLDSVRVKKTGAVIRFDPALPGAVLDWFRYYFGVLALPRPAGRPFTVAFLPDRPRPWYLIWPTVRAAGGRIISDPARADLVFQFEDATSVRPDLAPPQVKGRLLNFGATDVSKTRVAAAFEKAFGYGLSVDPETFDGPAVEKSEINGAHDGRIVRCPAARRPGHVYQRVIDNRCQQKPDLIEDLRTPMVGGRPGCVYIKRRRLETRFANENSEVELARPQDLFTPEEMDRLSGLCAELGLDWGGLDVLRDCNEGRLYVVDANKTDMGPPLALPLPDKLRSTEQLANAFRAFAVETLAED